MAQEPNNNNHLIWIDMEMTGLFPERDQIIEIATLLLPWCRDGNYGALFDGASNLSLTGKVAHFELGYIPDSALK